MVHGGHDPSFDRDRLVETCDDYFAAGAERQAALAGIQGKTRNAPHCKARRIDCFGSLGA
ncbi:MAG: hypothetical protein CMI61_09515 [Parvibaculum sp.]|nr:hypothetical protein [Parvibaculum sp.]